jgi:hypothetical protein
MTAKDTTEGPAFEHLERLGLTVEDILVASEQLENVARLGTSLRKVLVAIRRVIDGRSPQGYQQPPTDEQIKDLRMLFSDLGP